MGQPDEPTARGYNEAEIAAAEEQFDALIDAGITATVAAMVAAILAEPIPALVTDATLAPLFTLWNAYTADVLVPALTRIYLGSAETFLQTGEPTLLALSYELTDIAPLDEPAVVWMSQASNRLRNVGNIVWEEIREQLTEGVKAGDGIPELAARVSQAAGFSETRARLTARTEVAAASNGGAITQARALDLDMDKQWEATVPTDGRTRATHIAAHHQTVPLGAQFEVGDSMLDFPGDPTGEASEVCNCRCAVTFVNIRRRGEDPTVAAGFVEGQHPRDREGQFAETPGLDSKIDTLKLDGRISLGSDEHLVASREATTSGSSDNTVLLAMTRTPSGPELRLGIVANEDDSRWRAGNLGGTVRLDEAAIGRMDAALAGIEREGKQFKADFQDADDDFDTEKVLGSGIIPGAAWGDIAYEAAGIDDGEGGWELTMAVRPPDAAPSWNLFEDAVQETKDARFRPKDVRALRKHIAAMLEKAMSEQPETAAAATHTGAMIALVPTDADLKRLAVDDGEPAEELHLTMMYLGDAADLDADTQAAVHAMCADLAGRTVPIAGDGFALNVFNPHTTERDTALVMGVGGKELGSVQGAIAEWAERLASVPEQHAPFVPHVTLAYSDDLEMLPDLIGRLGPVGFDRLRVAFGDEVTDYPLTGIVDDSPFDADGWFAVTKGKIRIAQPGGFRRCVKALRDKPGVYDPEGLCATMHHRATGKWPGQNHGVTVAAVDEMPTPEVLAEQLAYEDMIAEAVPGAMFHALMHKEGVSTGRRVYMPGALTWRTPPFPFNWAIESGMHDGQQKVIEVGLITDVARASNEIHGWGQIDLDDPNALEYARKLAAGWVRGVSIGMDEQPIEVEYLYSPSDPEKVEQEVYLSGNIMELTSSGAVAQEAAYIEPLPALLEALAARGIEVASSGDECGCPDAPAPVS